MFDSFLAPVSQRASHWARSLVLATLGRGVVVGQVIINDKVQKEVLTFGKAEGPSSTIVVKDEALWWRVFTRSSLGFSEAYMLGEVDCDDMIAFLMIMIRNQDTTDEMQNLLSSCLFTMSNWLRPSNDVARSLENIKTHYDVSNEMFAAFLSPDMTYSCAAWLNPEKERRRGPTSDDQGGDGDTLEEAQMRKLRDIIRLADIQKSDHVLDIGGGWASFAIEAVRRTGCRVTALTLSMEQKTEAEARIAAAGLEESITFVLKDYREFAAEQDKKEKAGEKKTVFDKVVSLEMLEHVGRDHLASYFGVVDKLLRREGGVAVIQCITMAEPRYESYSKQEATFINRYIFPGGHLPSTTEIVKTANQGSNGALIPDRSENVGHHYGRTLEAWRDNFLAGFEAKIAPALRKKDAAMTELDVDIFRRKWVFYFSYCEAGFRSKMLGDCRIRFVREG